MIVRHFINCQYFGDIRRDFMHIRSWATSIDVGIRCILQSEKDLMIRLHEGFSKSPPHSSPLPEGEWPIGGPDDLSH
jgi:hypothetical protein